MQSANVKHNIQCAVDHHPNVSKLVSIRCLSKAKKNQTEALLFVCLSNAESNQMKVLLFVSLKRQKTCVTTTCWSAHSF